jgi:hypothetical protein
LMLQQSCIIQCGPKVRTSSETLSFAEMRNWRVSSLARSWVEPLLLPTSPP